jgi:cytochrome P450
MVAIHTTTMQSTHIWLDLAAHPEHIEPLRQELLEVLRSEPGGVLTKSSMPKLKKLDSFLKESQRCNPLGPLSFLRKVISPVTLHDGKVLPEGSSAASDICKVEFANSSAPYHRIGESISAYFVY